MELGKSRMRHVKEAANALKRLDPALKGLMLKKYFHMCKEKAAVAFINYRSRLAQEKKIPGMEAKIKYYAFLHKSDYETEEQIFKILDCFKQNYTFDELCDLQHDPFSKD